MSTRRSVVWGLAAGAASLALAAGAAVGESQAREPQARASSYLGTQVTVAEAPWIASMVMLDEDLKPTKGRSGGVKSSCSAAVIGERTVLTAAHCVDGSTGEVLSRMSVLVGSDNPGAPGGRLVRVARAWSPMLGSNNVIPARDMAVVETREPLGVPALPLASERPKVGETVTSFGFGDDTEVNDPNVERPFLRRLDTVVQETCPLTDAFCTIAPNGGQLRFGDSGGPTLMVRNGVAMLAGVNSALVKETSLNAFADVFAQREFIAAPPNASLVPMPSKETRITGRPRPGRRVTCEAVFTPAPSKYEYRWYLGPREDRSQPPSYFRMPNGRRVAYWQPRRPVSYGKSLVLPRDAGGKPLRCSVRVKSGNYWMFGLSSPVTRVPRR